MESSASTFSGSDSGSSGGESQTATDDCSDKLNNEPSPFPHDIASNITASSLIGGDVVDDLSASKSITNSESPTQPPLEAGVNLDDNRDALHSIGSTDLNMESNLEDSLYEDSDDCEFDNNDRLSDTQYSDKMAMLDEIEKIDQESKIASRAFEKRIEKHRSIQAKCQEDFENLDSEYRAKREEVDRRVENAKTRYESELAILEQDFERKVKEFQEEFWRRKTLQNGNGNGNGNENGNGNGNGNALVTQQGKQPLTSYSSSSSNLDLLHHHHDNSILTNEHMNIEQDEHNNTI